MPAILIENHQDCWELRMPGRWTRPLLGCEHVRVIKIIGREKAYPTKREDQQRQTCRTGCGSGEVPMSWLMFVVIMMVMRRMMMPRINLRMRMTAIVAIRTGIGNLGQMKVGKVVTVVMVMENRAAFGRAASVKEDQSPAARSGEHRLPVSDQSARSIHHGVIRSRTNIGLH